MTFEEKLKQCPAAEVWQEYCGFLDLSLPEYMQIQKRLVMEQVELMAACPLGVCSRTGYPGTWKSSAPWCP